MINSASFSLINEIGAEYLFGTTDRAFLTEVEGFAYETDNTFTKIGTKWVLDKSEDKQLDIQGVLHFRTNNRFEEELRFTKFIRQSKRLTLKVTLPNRTRYKDVVIQKYSLEAMGTQRLRCPIVLTPYTVWYVPEMTTYIASGVSGDEIRYSYRFPSSFNDYSEGVIEIKNDGSYPAGFIIRMNGAIQNPVVILKDNEEELYRLRINGEAESGEVIKYSSIDDDLYCVLDDGEGGITNLVPDFDISLTNFFKVPVGTYQFHFSADTPILSPVSVTIQKQYRAV